MSRLMKDHKKLSRVRHNLPYPKNPRKWEEILLILGMILLITTIYVVTVFINRPFPETEQDQINLISPEMQSYLETYHQEIDMYGVE